MGLAEYLQKQYGSKVGNKRKNQPQNERESKARKLDSEEPGLKSALTSKHSPASERVEADTGRSTENSSTLTRSPVTLVSDSTRAKPRERSDDPMARYSTLSPSPTNNTTQAKSPLGIPLYTDAFPPNRFDIAPGYKWDGLDRSNGFETRFLDAHN